MSNVKRITYPCARTGRKGLTKLPSRGLRHGQQSISIVVIEDTPHVWRAPSQVKAMRHEAYLVMKDGSWQRKTWANMPIPKGLVLKLALRGHAFTHDCYRPKGWTLLE